jgi:hypothetical protein
VKKRDAGSGGGLPRVTSERTVPEPRRPIGPTGRKDSPRISADRVDAERWRALIGSERIVDFASLVFTNRSEHIAFEFWSHSRQTLPAQKRTAEARKLLTKYADDRRKEG